MSICSEKEEEAAVYVVITVCSKPNLIDGISRVFFSPSQSKHSSISKGRSLASSSSLTATPSSYRNGATETGGAEHAATRLESSRPITYTFRLISSKDWAFNTSTTINSLSLSFSRSLSLSLRCICVNICCILYNHFAHHHHHHHQQHPFLTSHTPI